MKLIEKRCPNCSASLKFSDDANEVTCEYCGTYFQVEKEDEDKHKPYDPEAFKLHAKVIKNLGKGIFIIWLIMFLFGITFFLIIFLRFFLR